MTEPLTRKQVEDIWKGLDKTLRFNEWCQVQNMVHTDAALRARVEELEQALRLHPPRTGCSTG